MKKIKYVLPVCLVALLFSCGKKEEVQEETLPLVKLQQVKVQPVDQTFDYTGTVQPFNENNIAPSMPLRINRILVEVGDVVKAGQAVATMDQAQYAQQRAQLNNLQVTYERMKNLYEVGGISKHDLDQAETAWVVAKTAAQNLDENSTLRSPISGIVTARNYDNGDMFSALPVIVVQQLNPVKVLINISEELFPKIKKDMPVDLKLDIYPDQIFNGKISLIHPTIDPVSHTFVAEVSIPNADLKVRPGMFGRITLSLGTVDHVVVPDQAIVKQQGTNERYVFVYNQDSTVTRQTVELGRRLDNRYEIVSGLKKDAQVVIAGQTRLLDGIKVEVQD
ncbi:MAG: efflux RND transporter periplasmic adaptor subunit [Candidatus Azobacteroides sp.]|nr:efflux RND transporter periplasmic adaptor subunit [Candidatus Azobacteroides sp.]